MKYLPLVKNVHKIITPALKQVSRFKIFISLQLIPNEKNNPSIHHNKPPSTRAPESEMYDEISPDKITGIGVSAVCRFHAPWDAV